MGEPTRFSLNDGMDLAGIDFDELWWRYVALGGTADPTSLASWVIEAEHCGEHEHDLVAQALNEVFLERGLDTFPIAYSGSKSFVLAASRPALFPPMSRSLEARQQAARARVRSASAARRSAGLHATAAQLMQASGQLQFARRAETRARAARRRAA